MDCPFKEAHPTLFREPLPDAYFRFMNAAPKAPGLKVYLDNELLISNLNYQSITEYYPVISRSYNIKVYTTKSNDMPIIDTDINIPKNTITNIAFIGVFPDIMLYPIPEPDKAQNSGRPCIRVVALSPDAAPIDLIAVNGTKIFTKVKYMDYTLYACIPEGAYGYSIEKTGTKEVLYTVPKTFFKANTYYGIYIVGLTRGMPQLSVVQVEEPR